ncbi:MAG: NAD(P)/FAD-dependent oxidoreductase [Paracoccaceae bacterium]
MKINIKPDNDKTCGWYNVLPPREPHAALEADIAADWLVVGAGYAGLAAARRLAENRPDEKIVILDAGVSGENASGRNSGFAIDTPHTTTSDEGELKSAAAYMRLSRAAIAYHARNIEAHGITCDWHVAGKYQTTVTDRGRDEMLVPFAKTMDQLGEDYRWCDAGELARVLGTSHYKHAIYTPGNVLLNPAALTRGLADTLPENVAVHENTPVASIDYRNGVQVTTSTGGAVRAPRMILAANGFSDQFGLMQNKFVHFETHASLTRPLTDEEMEIYGVTEPWGVTPINAAGGITQRFTNDRRLLIRNQMGINTGRSVTKSRQADVARIHKKKFDEYFPNLPDVTMEHTWTGFICLSRNGAPAWGKIASNVWLAACQNAVGVTKGTISGLLAADLACGRDNPLIEDMRSLGEPEDLPPRWMTEIGSRVRLGWEVFKSRHEA